MGIAVFGIDPASKSAIEVQNRVEARVCWADVAEDEPISGAGQLSGRVARGSTLRKAACGSAFRLFFSAHREVVWVILAHFDRLAAAAFVAVGMWASACVV